MYANDSRVTLKKNAKLSNLTVGSVETTDSLGFDKYDADAIPLDFDVPLLGPDHFKEIEKCNGYEPEHAKLHWDHLSVNYEGLYKRLGYPDPTKVAEMADKHAATKGLNKDTCQVLDLGCGTGLVGQALAAKGFKNIVGVDISPDMMAKAKMKNIYSDLVEHDLSNKEDFPRELNNSFDIVVSAGLINNNHMDEDLFEVMMATAKKGGMIIFASRISYIGDYWYNTVLTRLAAENRLKLAEQSEDFFKYDRLDQSVGRFSRTPARVFAFENMVDCETYKINRLIFRLMRQAFREKFCISKA